MLITKHLLVRATEHDTPNSPHRMMLLSIIFHGRPITDIANMDIKNDELAQSAPTGDGGHSSRKIKYQEIYDDRSTEIITVTS
jgi:hypothetical protein